MRPETKELIQQKAFSHLRDGNHQHDPQGEWLHLRDLRGIIDLETELLKKQIEKLKNPKEYGMREGGEDGMSYRPTNNY